MLKNVFTILICKVLYLCFLILKSLVLIFSFFLSLIPSPGGFIEDLPTIGCVFYQNLTGSSKLSVQHLKEKSESDVERDSNVNIVPLCSFYEVILKQQIEYVLLNMRWTHCAGRIFSVTALSLLHFICCIIFVPFVPRFQLSAFILFRFNVCKLMSDVWPIYS